MSAGLPSRVLTLHRPVENSAPGHRYPASVGRVSLDLVAVALLLGLGGWLSVIDWREHRLPNRLTLPLFAALTTVLTLAAAIDGSWLRWGGALLGAAALSGFYLLLALLPAGMGMGDVKFALSIGLLCGWWSLDAWLLGLILPFVIGGFVGLGAVVLRLRRLRDQIAFGPLMFIGWLMVAVLHG